MRPPALREFSSAHPAKCFLGMVKGKAFTLLIGGLTGRTVRQHFTSARFADWHIFPASTAEPGRGRMFDQTVSGTLRNMAVALVFTAAIVGAAFALAFA